MSSNEETALWIAPEDGDDDDGDGHGGDARTEVMENVALDTDDSTDKPGQGLGDVTKAECSSNQDEDVHKSTVSSLAGNDDDGKKRHEEEEKNDVLSTDSAFAEMSKVLKDGKRKQFELFIRISPNEPNRKALDVAENALLMSPFLEGRLILRESLRSVVEVGSQPIAIDIKLSQDLDRCVCVCVQDELPPQLFPTLREEFEKQIQLNVRGSDLLARDTSTLEDEHEEAIDGPAVMNLLDPEYVTMLKHEMHVRAERDLNHFALPLEQRALNDEGRVIRLQKLLSERYQQAGLPLPALEKTSLAEFQIHTRPGKNQGLILRKHPTPREVDAQLKMAIRRELHAKSLARQERKKKQVLTRAEMSERNRAQLVSVLSNSRAALDHDLDLMSRLNVSPPQVALCQVAAVYNKRPGFLIVTASLILFEVRLFGFTFNQSSSNIRLEAERCRSVHHVNSPYTALCLRTDHQHQQEFVFIIPPTSLLAEESSEHVSRVFELIWQVLRMNRAA